MERRWNKAWKDLPQETIQHWIERIPHHISEIIRLKGGNEYSEKIPGFKRSWKGDRLKGQLSTNSYNDPDRSVGRSTPEKLPKTVQKDVSQHQERQDSIPIPNSDSEADSDEEDWIWAEDAEEEYDRRQGI
jgi:hypothetical protein